MKENFKDFEQGIFTEEGRRMFSAGQEKAEEVIRQRKEAYREEHGSNLSASDEETITRDAVEQLQQEMAETDNEEEKKILREAIKRCRVNLELIDVRKTFETSDLRKYDRGD